jgi:peptidoglycan/LPS O-acetylase OafA/YrhL
VLGPLVTSLDVSRYLQDPGTKAYVFLNSTMWTVYTLPGVFADNVYPDAVNGSLWTLPVEIKAYALIALIGVIGFFRWRRGAIAVVAVAVYASLLTIDGARHALPLGDRVVAMLSNTQAGQAAVAQAHAGAYLEWARVFAAFMIGTALFSLRRWIPLRWDLALALALVWGLVLSIDAEVGGRAFVFLVPFAVLMLAYRTAHWFGLPRRMGDYSYGIYILAFPVQQAIAHWITPTSGWVMFLLATPITIALAAASWHLVEAPSLTLKKYLAAPLDRAVDEAVPPAPRAELSPADYG